MLLESLRKSFVSNCGGFGCGGRIRISSSRCGYHHDGGCGGYAHISTCGMYRTNINQSSNINRNGIYKRKK